MDAVRHIAIADEPGVFALGAFESRVQVWRRRPLGKMAEFDTFLEFGGQRLELSSDGTRCFAAAYHANGVACYDTFSGELLWQRRDLKKVQVLRRSVSDDGLYCFFDKGAAHLLSGLTGETKAKHSGMRGIVQSPFVPVDLVEGREFELRSRDGRVIRKIPRSTFALLSACFSPDLLLISESGGGLRCFDASTGEDAWRVSPDEGEHFLSVSYYGHSHCFHGVARRYQIGGQQRLVELDADGIVRSSLPLGTPAIAAFMAGELVTSDGEMIDLDSRESTWLRSPPHAEAKGARA